MIQKAIIFIIITSRPGLNTVNRVSQLSHLVKCARAQILEHSQIILLFSTSTNTQVQLFGQRIINHTIMIRIYLSNRNPGQIFLNVLKPKFNVETFSDCMVMIWFVVDR